MPHSATPISYDSPFTLPRRIVFQAHFTPAAYNDTSHQSAMPHWISFRLDNACHWLAPP